MSIPLTTSYEEITEQLGEYVQGRVDAAADTTHGYLKKEAALRADGAIRLWIALFVGPSAQLEPDARKRVEHDLVRLRTLAQSITPDER